MALLNRSSEFDHLYDSDGRLQGGLSALEELADVIAISNGDERDNEAMDERNDEVEPAQELPVTCPLDSPSLLDSDEDMSDDEPGSSDDEAMEEIVMYHEPAPTDIPPASIDDHLQIPPTVVPSSPNAASLPSPTEIAAQERAAAPTQRKSLNSESDNSTIGRRSQSSRRTSRRQTPIETAADVPTSIGEKFKRRMLDVGVISTFLVGFIISA
jgi:serine/threonine-protein phosphatase 6 regulatory subunit 3